MESTTNFASAWQQHAMNSIYERETAVLSSASGTNSSSQTDPGKSKNLSPHPTSSCGGKKRSGTTRLNKFVRRLHDMLLSEQEGGIVEWRKGLLVLHSTDAFTKTVLPKYFNTKNFKTFRRQLNYYGFVHVRSFSTTGSTTTALWVNQDLAKRGSSSISSVLMLKRVEPCDTAKTAEGRRVRKEEAANTVEDIGINTRAIQMEQIRQLAMKAAESSDDESCSKAQAISPPIPSFVNCAHETESTSSESTPCLMLPSPLSPKPHDQNRNTSIENNYSTSTDDAANLLIMFSKSSNKN